jgi:pimeloyl-ACP methyl ester carboxylesterase
MENVPLARANGIDIEYQTFGEPDGPPILLIAGLGVQMLSWDDGFCNLLARRGFRVIRFDNRDSGLSTWIDAAGPPDVAAALTGEAHAAYQLEDMAADAAGLLAALDMPAAHIVGSSMGGFVAQLVAINHPDRVLTLTSIMSGPGGRDQVAPSPDGAAVLLAIPPTTREERIAQGMWARRVLKGSLDPYDEHFELARVSLAIDRAYNPDGAARQFIAVLAAQSRLERLGSVRVPTLVIHGVEDILVPVENGRLVASAVPGARLLEIEGMGHDLPERVWSEVVDAIADLAQQTAVT